MKNIGEVFSDYKTESNIKLAQIEGMNLLKKVNVLEINIISTEYIEIKELWFFEQFLRERFMFSNIDIKIKYEENVNIKPIEKEWINLVAYMVHKYPLMKPMILLKSTIDVNDKNINVNMKIRGADFLRAKKLDRELERTIKNLFNLNYKINFVEVLNSEEQAKLLENVELNKKQAIERALEHMQLGEKIADERREQEKTEKAKNNNESIPPIPPPEEPQMLEFDEETPLIYGRNPNLKTKIISVADISPEDDIAAIVGEILSGSIEERELKSGKFLISFNVYLDPI